MIPRFFFWELLLSFESYQLRDEIAVPYRDASYADGEREATWAGASGIEVEDFAFEVELGFVRVPEDDGGKLGSAWIEVEFGDVVEHINVSASDFGDFSDWISLSEG